jgi:asparagine synthase (glutamine-hydrolysing)
MSGIVGIVNLDGAPVDRPLLKEMTDHLCFRGPDAQSIWIDGNVGFGHTMLRTTWESESEHQPLSLDGQVWITADARVDDRENLLEKLKSKGQEVVSTAPDVELILHAYHAFGEQSVEHLLGDFAFAIWDGRTKRLFCSRDHLGVKPFYYFRSGKTFVFSNTLNCVRRHPDVSDKLNDLAVADFLLFDLNQDKATTTFSDVQRIAPAHSLTVSKDRCISRRYWSMPIDEPVYYKRNSDYVDRFTELLTIAVRDRTRTPWIGVFMSGGLDSSSMAATASRLSDRPPTLEAFTAVFDRLIPDEERYYSGLVAKRLGIPIHYRVRDDNVIDPEWSRRPIRTPEPAVYSVARAQEVNRYRSLAEHGRVFFYGEGPDNSLMYEWRPYLAYLARERRWTRLIRDVSQHMIAHRRILPMSTILSYGRRIAVEEREQGFPPWLDDDFAARTDARSRWQTMRSPADSPHPVRPAGFDSLASPLWQRVFEATDPGYTEAPVEIRHPYVDLRLLRYMLSVPTLPWCRRKHLIRQAMRNILPEEVLRRDKAPVAGSPVFQVVRQTGMQPLVPTGELLEYVNPRKVPNTMASDSSEFWLNLRPVVLNHWLWCSSVLQSE